ncbi:MAG: hypothetical protein K6L73_13175 [Cellvibrionaceae bacterium]
MKLLRKMTVVTVGVLIISVLTACNNVRNGGSPEKTIVHYGSNSVYAKLNYDDETGFFFSDYAFREFPESVKLNNLSHNFFTGILSCNRVAIGGASRSCHFKEGSRKTKYSLSELSEHFYVVDKNVSSLLSGGLSSALSTVVLGGLTASVFYKLKFDEGKAQAAIHDAASKIDRASLLNEIDTRVSEMITQLDSDNQKVRNSVNKLQMSLAEKSKIVDSTGLFNRKKTDILTFPYTLVSRSQVLNNTSTWNSVDSLATNLSSAVEKEKENHRVSLSCKSLYDFSTSYSGCEQSWNAYSLNYGLSPIRVNILNKKRVFLDLPLNISDSHIEVTSGKAESNIYVSNNTGVFLQVDAISLYIGEDVATLDNLGVSIPPNAKSIVVSVNRFAHKHKLNLYNVTKKDLENTLNFGIAVKYKVIDTSKEHTLYKQFTKRIGDLVRI